MGNSKFMTFRKSLPWVIWMITVSFFALQFIMRVSPELMKSGIIPKFGIGASSFGLFMAIYYVGYGGLQIILGILLDRFNYRYVLAACIMLCVAGTIPMYASDSWTVVLIGRFMVGVGSSVAVLGVLKTLRIWFPPQHYTFLVGISVSIGLSGAIYGSGPISVPINEYGWDNILQLMVYAGVIIAILLVMFRFNPIYKDQDKKEAEEEFHGTLFDELKMVFGNKKVMFICLIGGLMVGPFEGFADAWGQSFMQDYYGFNQLDAGFIKSMLFAGMGVGGPLMGFFARKLKSDYLLVYLCALVMLLIFSLIFFIPFENKMLLKYTLIALLFIAGVASSYQVIVFTIVANLVPNSVMGLATAVTNTVNVLVGALFHMYIGYVMEVFRDKTLPVDIYQPSLYMISLGIIPVSMLLSIIGIYYIKPKNNQVQ